MKSIFTVFILFFTQTVFAQSDLITLPKDENYQLLSKTSECYQKLSTSPSDIDRVKNIAATDIKMVDGKIYQVEVTSNLPYFAPATMSSVTFYIWSGTKKKPTFPLVTIRYMYVEAWGTGTLMYQTTQRLNATPRYEKDEAKVRIAFYDLLQRFDQLL